MRRCFSKVMICALLLATVAGCTPHLSKQQCLSMNWYQLGYQDGSQGKYQRQLTKDIQDCARFKLQVNASSYRRGWQAGVRDFCQPRTAYQLGVNGATYNNICPADLAAKFNQAYRRGLVKFCVPDTGYNIGRAGKPMPGFCSPRQVVAFRNAYIAGRRVFITISNIQGQINDLNAQIADANQQINGLQHEIDHMRDQLVRNKDKTGKPYSAAEREVILMRIDDNRRAIARNRDRIDGMTDQIDGLRAQLSDVESHS